MSSPLRESPFMTPLSFSTSPPRPASPRLIFSAATGWLRTPAKTRLGLPGRDEEIENYIAVIKALSEVGVPMICYNWMAGLGWYRTKVDLRGRGGALISEFDNEAANRQGLTEWGEVSEEQIWSNLEYFLKAVI